MFASYVASFFVIVTMIFIIVYTEKELARKETISKLRKYVLNFILFMMADMFAGLTWFFSTPPSFLNSIIAVNIIMVPMTSFVVILFYVYSLDIRMRWNPDSLVFPAYFVVNEILMSFFVMVISGVKFTSSILYDIPLAANSLVFVVPMEVEMVFSIIIFKVRRTERSLLVLLAVMDLISPAIFHFYSSFFLVANALIMVAGMIIVLEAVASAKSNIQERRKMIINISILVYILNSFGFLASYVLGSGNEVNWLPYSISVMLGMLLYFYYVLSASGQKVVLGWVKRKLWLFYVLAGTFVSELLMSVPLNILAGIMSTGGSGISAFSYLVTHNIDYWHITNAWVSVIPFIGSLANSPVFLILMGIEMGALVVVRIIRIKWLEKRVNLTFALAAYFIYTVYGPNFIGFWDKLPLWANVGALGPFDKLFIIPLALSYVVYAVLALLFGRRSYCSTLCPSAVMYGGTLGQEMIALNYKSRISRKNIGSRFSSLVMKIISAAWIFMVISAALSFLSFYGYIHLSFDPAVLYSFLIWNFIWYIYFISIPFVGMSPCRRYGWCTTGTFVGFFSILGLFRIKAIDPMTCYNCKTKDCVTACEVGLGDLPGQFMKRGYFKSMKCVGSGSCIEACPYDNIHFYDIRNFLREKLGRESSEID